MIAIRAAAPLDARRLAELRWEFRAGKQPPVEEREVFVDRCAAWISEQLTLGAWRAWIAQDGDAVVGQLWMCVLPKVPNPNGERDRHAYISNVYVTPAARGGIGTRLLETAVAWASAGHVDRIVLWPTPRSRTMYMRHGFTPHGDVLELTCR